MSNESVVLEVIIMASSLPSKSTDNLTCSICMKQLQDPKVLPCLHSYCHKCIVKLTENVKNYSLSCPRCHSTVKVTDSQNLPELPSNIFANNLIAAMALTDEKKVKKIVCDNCDSEDVAETRCNECQVFLCNFCSASHKRTRTTKLHKVLSIQEIRSLHNPGSIAEKMKCKKHKEEMIKLYCKTCKMTVCRDCTIVDHREHNYKFVEDVAAKEKENLLTNLKEIKQRKERITEGIKELERFDQGLVAKEKFTIDQINQYFKEIAKVLESKRNEMVNKTTSLTKTKQQKIHDQIEKLNMSLASCTSGVSFTEEALKNGNDVQILSMQSYIMDSLEMLKTGKDCIQPTANDDLQFAVSVSVEKSAHFFAVDIVKNIVTSPERCTASINQEVVQLKRKSAITIICNDIDNKRIHRGGQTVKAMISGVKFSDCISTDNNDGSHTVSFIPQSAGQLKFDAEINGTPAPSCSLIRDVRWVMSDIHGNGTLTNKGLTLTGDGQHCWRIGQCYFENGVHTWNVRLNSMQASGNQFRQEQYYYQTNWNETPIAEIGVVDSFGWDFGKRQKTNCVTTWIRYIQVEKSLNVVLTLDMENKTLTFSNIDPYLVSKHNEYPRSSRRYNSYYNNLEEPQENMVLKLNAKQVSPYFGTLTRDVSITILN